MYRNVYYTIAVGWRETKYHPLVAEKQHWSNDRKKMGATLNEALKVNCVLIGCPVNSGIITHTLKQ